MRQLSVVVVAWVALLLGAAAPTAAQWYGGYYGSGYGGYYGGYDTSYWTYPYSNSGWSWSYPSSAWGSYSYQYQPSYTYQPSYQYTPQTYYVPERRASRCSMADRLQLSLDGVDRSLTDIICR
jgi:hypothetical protein